MSSSLGSGGAERVLSQLANHWAGNGLDVTLVTVFGAESDFYELHPAVRRVALGMGWHSSGLVSGVLGTLRRAVNLRRAIVHSRPDAVLAFVDQTNVLTLLATLGLGLRVVVSERNNPVDTPRLWRWPRNVLYPRARAVVVQTPGAALDMRAIVPRARIEVIPNPVSSVGSSMPAANGRVRRIVGLGRLHRQKGFDVLLRAFALVSPRFPDWELVVAGEGADRADLEKLRDVLGLVDRVRFPGRTNSPFELLGSSAVFALSSRYEGYPNVLIEAMACGCACVAADCDFGPRDIVRDGVDGLLVRSEDERALALGLERLMADESLRSRLGRAALEVTARLGLPEIERAWRGVLLPPGQV
ncbi:MAG: glycosyltransferase family 4 protein [Anaeromyxobacteraceae bacterium]